MDADSIVDEVAAVEVAVDAAVEAAVHVTPPRQLFELSTSGDAPEHSNIVAVDALFLEEKFLRQGKRRELEAAMRGGCQFIFVVGPPGTLKTSCVKYVRCAFRCRPLRARVVYFFEGRFFVFHGGCNDGRSRLLGN